MVKTYKLGKIASPSAVFSGYTLLVFGALTTYFSFMGILLLLLGGVMAFSLAEVMIDEEAKQYTYRVKLIGFIPLKSVKKFQPGDAAQVKHIKGKYYTYSRSNRESFTPVNDYRVYLHEAGTNKKILIGKFKDETAAREQSALVEKIIQSTGRERMGNE